MTHFRSPRLAFTLAAILLATLAHRIPAQTILTPPHDRTLTERAINGTDDTSHGRFAKPNLDFVG